MSKGERLGSFCDIDAVERYSLFLEDNNTSRVLLPKEIHGFALSVLTVLLIIIYLTKYRLNEGIYGNLLPATYAMLLSMIGTTASHFYGLADAATGESPSTLVVLSVLAMLIFHIVNLAYNIGTMRSILCCYWTRSDYHVITASSLLLLYSLIAKQKNVMSVGVVSQMKFVYTSFIAVTNQCFDIFDVFKLVSVLVWMYCFYYESSNYCTNLYGFPLHAISDSLVIVVYLFQHENWQNICVNNNGHRYQAPKVKKVS